jgi:titin
VNTAINVGKTYVYKVQAFNGRGTGPESAEIAARTPWDLPLPPESLQFLSSTTETITMTWADVSDNETGWIVFRQDAGTGNLGQLDEVARFPTGTLFGGVQFTDGDVANPAVAWAAGYLPPQAGRCYNYVVEAYNASGTSGWNINGPVQMCAAGMTAPTALHATAVAGNRVDLAWTAASGTFAGYVVERARNVGFTGTSLTQFLVPALAATWSDVTVSTTTTYYYRVFAYAGSVRSTASNVIQVTTPVAPPPAVNNLTATVTAPAGGLRVNLSWTHNGNRLSTGSDAFIVERSADGGATFTQVGSLGRTARAFVDTQVSPKTGYVYLVHARGPGGDSADREVSVVTPGEIPEPPSQLRVTSRNRTSVSLAWKDNSVNEQGFWVERSFDGVTFTRIATRPANATTYVDGGLPPDRALWYRVQAFNADGASAFAAAVQTRTKR